MKKITLAFSTILVLSLLVCFSLAIAAEEKFPNRPITIINPLPPGGPPTFCSGFSVKGQASRLGSRWLQ